MKVNVGPTEKKIRMAVGIAAATTAIFVPLRYKWKGMLTAAAVAGLLTGSMGYSPFKKVFGLGR